MNGSVFKTVVTIGILVALVGGISFVSQYASRKPSDDPPASADVPTTALVFPRMTDETLFSEMTPATGYCDYLFTNPAAYPVELGLDFQSCKCAGVDVRTLNDIEKETFVRLAPRGGIAQTLAAPLQPWSTVTIGAALRDQLQGILGSTGDWLQLMVKKGTLFVPPEGSGLVRLRWEGKQEGPQRLKAVLWSQPVGKTAGRSYHTIELPMVYVPPINIQPREAEVKELVAGSKRGIGFVCFSTTRCDFSITAHEENNDPCIEVKCVPTSPEECAKHLKDLEQKFPILKGYVVEVIVHENRNGKQLDFGPFRRRINVTSDVYAEPAVVTVKGIVASDLRVVGEKQNQINLELFEADRGTTKRVPIESDRPGLQLVTESHSPEILKIKLEDSKLTPGGGQQWILEVAVPPNSVNGRLPPDSEIVLKTKDTPPRRFRIPVVGHAVIR